MQFLCKRDGVIHTYLQVWWHDCDLLAAGTWGYFKTDSVDAV